MSPLWRDRLIIALAPERLSAIRVGRGVHPRPLRHHEVRLEADPAVPWRPGLAALQDLVREPQWQTHDVEVVLSSHWVRYAVIPGDAGAQTGDERVALGALVFRQTFGTLCQDWSITLSDAPKGLSTLGAAIPAALIEALRSGIGRPHRLRSIRPDLMDAFNRIGTGLKNNPEILALVDSGRVTIGQVADGAWTSILSRLTPIDDAKALASVLEEAAALCTFPDDASLWLRDLTGTAGVPADLSARVRTIPAPWPGHPTAAFMA